MMNWMFFSPELFTLGIAGIYLTLSLMPSHARRDDQLARILVVIGLVICFAGLKQTGELFAGTYRVDLFSQGFKVMIYAGFAIIIGLCRNLSGVAENHRSEVYLLMSLCTLALMMLVSAVHLLPLYIALETSSYTLYVLVSLRRGYSKALASGLKYFLIGATASALMLFGFALLYISCKSLYLVDLGRLLPHQLNDPLTQTGFILALSGLLFKLGVVPFHFWAPDVYEGAPHQVSAYIATVSKVAAVAVMVRLLALWGSGGAHFIIFLGTLSVLSMTLGNLSALAQDDLKRLLAYSSIAHAGYILIGLLSMNRMGWTSTVFYGLSILIMKLTAFMAIILVSEKGDNMRVSQLAGLHKKAPALSLALMLALFGLAGIPPTIGFTAKLLIFKAALQNGFMALVIFAMVNVVISLYYYLKILKAAYFMPSENEAGLYKETVSVKLLSYLMVVLMILGGIYPQKIIAIAEAMIMGAGS